MKGGSKLFLIAGIGLAVVAVVIFMMGMSGDKKADANPQNAPVEKVSVVQAAVAIPAHTILKPTDLVVVEMPVTDAPADAIKTTGEVLNMAYRLPLAQGQTLLKAQLEQPGIRNDIEAGKRAISLPVNEANMLAGLVQDGDYVDVVFKTRVNLVRLLPTNFAETPEDTPSYEYGAGKDDGDEDSDSGGGDSEEDESSSNLPATASGPILWVAAGFEIDLEIHPYAGDPGSQFVIQDAGLQLEKVAKVLVQDVKVLRVVRPGESFGPDGSLAGQSATTDAPAQPNDDAKGHLILQVSPGQAEALAFIQDEENHHTYQIVVRGKDDHERVETTGITFEILATDEEWSMPWPQSVTAPEEDAVIVEDDGNSINDLATPTAEGTPAAEED